jgi:hypothetical protein
VHLTRCLAVALGPEISVNSWPGLVEGTRMAKRIPEEVVDDIAAGCCSRIPRGRRHRRAGRRVLPAPTAVNRPGADHRTAATSSAAAP